MAGESRRPLLLRVLKTKVLEEASAAALETTVNEWMESQGEQGLVHIEWDTDGATWWCFITYSEQ